MRWRQLAAPRTAALQLPATAPAPLPCPAQRTLRTHRQASCILLTHVSLPHVMTFLLRPASAIPDAERRPQEVLRL